MAIVRTVKTRLKELNLKLKDLTERLWEKGAKLLLYVPKTEKGRQSGIFTGELEEVKANDGSGNFWNMPMPGSDWTLWGGVELLREAECHPLDADAGGTGRESIGGDEECKLKENMPQQSS